jgi:hypothetical protein
MAETILFLLVSNLVQRFRFMPENYFMMKGLQSGRQGILYTPPEYKIRAIPRDTALV